MPALDRNVKVTCGRCGTSVTKNNLSRHKLSCSGGSLYFSKCPNFSTKSRDDLNYHIAKQHSLPTPSITYKCKRNSGLLCLTSTQKHSTWNTNLVRSEQY